MFEQPTTDLFPPGGFSHDALGEAVVSLLGQVAAAQCQALCWIAAYESAVGWEGTPGMASFLGYRAGMGSRAARETVALARRLQELPGIRAAFSEGKLCWSQVAALARVATPGIEDELIHLAREATGAMLERALRRYRWLLATHAEAAQNEAAMAGRQARGLSYHFDDEGFFHLSGTFGPEAGAVIEAALAQVAAELKAEARELAVADSPTETAHRPWEARQADALLAICESVRDSEASARPGGARQEIVVHVDAGLLSGAEPGEEARCELAGAGAPLAPESARRIACDASVVAIIEDADGRPLSVGRRSRSIPTPIRTALASRDQGCVFPGCGATRCIEGHHIVHWAQGGETSLGNLLSLCWSHHVLVHEGGYRVVVGAPGAFCFLRPDASVVGGEPRPEVAYRAQLGFGVTPSDTLCQYSGGRMDLGEVIAGLYARDGRFSGVPRDLLREQVHPPGGDPPAGDGTGAGTKTGRSKGKKRWTAEWTEEDEAQYGPPETHYPWGDPVG